MQMFALESSINGKSYTPVFVQHRLRKYTTLTNAVNGATHFIGSRSFKGNIIRVYDVETKEPMAYIRRIEDGRHTLEYCEPSASNSPALERDNAVPIESLVDSREGRLEFLKECYKRHLMKKKGEDMVEPAPVNIPKPEASHLPVSASRDFAATFNTKVIELAIKMNDYKTLFYTEMRLIKMGYTWYPDEGNAIKVKPLQEAIDSIGGTKKGSRKKDA